MALIVRTDQRAEFVHVTDTDCDPNGKRGPHEGWLHAEGQPPGCTRVGVRPLNPDEFRSLLTVDGGEEQVLLAHATGFLGLDGGEVVPVGHGFQAEVGGLVIALTTDPMTGRRSESAGESKAASTSAAVKSADSNGSRSSVKRRSRSSK
jgi:hypothetical protein